jgi:hypothetical protein
MALDDMTFLAAPGSAAADELVAGVDPKSLALARITALVAAGGSVQSFGSAVANALECAAEPDEIVAVVIGIAPVVGSAAVSAAALPLALALGYDIEEALEAPTPRPPP